MGVIEARRRILLTTPHPVTTTPAPVASFDTDMVGKLRSAKFAFSPVQSGSGDPSPTNVRPISGWDGVTVERCGKNLLNYATETVGYRLTNTGNVTAGSNYSTSDYIPVIQGVSYYFNAVMPSGNGYSICCYSDTDTGSFVNYKNIGTGTSPVSGSYTIPTGTGIKYIRVSYWKDYTGNPAVLSAGTAYTPYTGTTIPVTFGAVNKNLFSGTLGEKWYHSFHTGEKYTISATCTGTGYGIARTYTNDDTFVQSISISGGTGDRWHSVLTISADADYMIISKSANTLSMTDIMVVQGDDTAHTDYVPYGTIYGGYVDVAKGVVVAEWGMDDMSTFNWVYRNNNVFSVGGISNVDNNQFEIMCSQYKADNTLTAASIVNYDNVISSYSSYTYKNVMVRDSRYENKDVFKAAMSGVKLAYKLATPITYALTPTIIKSLRGANNLWSNANGDATITYWTH